MLQLLHLCDSLFPIGAFAYSDGLEASRAEAFGKGGTPDATRAVEDLRSWIDVCLDETIGRVEGPTLWRAWLAVHDRDWDALARLDEEAIALRPSSSARRSSRAMGRRLVTTWQMLHPAERVEHVLVLARRGALGPALPVAFAAACASAGVERRTAVEAFAYTRLAATISAAMRLMAIGQTEAHRLLARALDRVPQVAGAIEQRNAAAESFAPALDIAVMSQQYLHSRLFRS